jgi:branched-chain amino acid transport system ATP-binding protein
MPMSRSPIWASIKLSVEVDVLQINSLNTYYGDSHILHGVDLSIQGGKAVGLLGRNGMGKTTLIRSLIGYVPAASGSVFWRDKEVTGYPPEKMARLGIGYVPEGRGIFPNLSVRENLVMSARPGPTGRDDWTYERVLDTFPRLRERLDHGGQQLSGGEQQMLSIGRALMTNPDLLILDEATEGLAPLIVQEIWNVVSTIRTTGISTLIVDRNYRAVLSHTDSAVVLEKGKIVLNGDSADLLSSPEVLANYLGV